MDIKYDRLPLHMQDAAQAYIETGRPPGGFLGAVLENRLTGAFAHADETNQARMFDWVMWLCNDIPNGAHGSPAKVAAWINHNGLKGNDNG